MRSGATVPLTLDLRHRAALLVKYKHIHVCDSTLGPLGYKLQELKLVQHNEILQTQYLIMMVLEPRETVLLLKLWPQKHVDLNSIPSTHVKNVKQATHTCNLSTGKMKTHEAY